MNKNSNGGLTGLGLLTVAFIVLKILGYISWSWIWVLSPIWLSVALIVVALFTAFVLAWVTTK